MTFPAQILPPEDSADPARTQRHDGWTADRQRAFLQALSEGSSVSHACQIVGLSVQSAYAFRRAARGAGFALGWQAAQLLAREVLADTLMDRALHGTQEIRFHPDGSDTSYCKYDNHLALKMLARMDRMADTAQREATHAAARLVAGEFDQFLDVIARDGGPARAGLFLGARLGAEAVPADADDLAPVRALARADRWLRTHTDMAEPLATADLDPAARADWTAEQWARAEAAGLVALAPPPADPTPPEPKLPKLSDLENPDGDPVWWDMVRDHWRTDFPPPEDFYGEEEGDYGEDGYSRELTDEERDMVEAPIRAEREARRAVEAVERDAWFAEEAALAQPAPAPDGEPHAPLALPHPPA
ncbi:hypothetical protein [Sphingomonas hengshuiensis]|uniref:hypothetical protein n=1 Tax=Sphingomonas hengshuiensis TaxID=1609977 RepID=UPI000698CD69|nr:hypothetical protein [Sphingomonas hengshuiensis]